MASVAICPHCYLQLVVPDGIEPDERVECPTCAKEFGLGQAVLRAIPEVVRRSPATSPAESIADEIVIDEVVEINEELEGSPELVNESPYGQGWMIVVEMENPAELEELLSAEEYKKVISQ